MHRSSVRWGERSPVWDEPFTFYAVSAAAELAVSLWDVPGRPPAAAPSADALRRATFLGTATVPLGGTLPPSCAPAAAPRHGTYPLRRRDGRDAVSGAVTLSVEWSVSALSLLQQKFAVLSKVLLQRNEILSMLRPMPAADVAAAIAAAGTAAADAGTPPPPPFSLVPLLTPLLTASDALHDLSATALLTRGELRAAPRGRVDVTASVLEVRNVPRRRGLGAALSATGAPAAGVALRCGGEAHSWSALARGSSAGFDAAARHTFANVPAAAALAVTVHDTLNATTRAQHAAVTLPVSYTHLTLPTTPYV